MSSLAFYPSQAEVDAGYYFVHLCDTQAQSWKDFLDIGKVEPRDFSYQVEGPFFSILKTSEPKLSEIEFITPFANPNSSRKILRLRSSASTLHPVRSDVATFLLTPSSSQRLMLLSLRLAKTFRQPF